jgi:transcription initiation factor TFIIH subunit 3
MQTLLSEPTSSLPTAAALTTAGTADLDAHTNAVRNAAIGPQLVTRILVFSVSPADLSGQYIALMNAVFAAQRLNVPIDMLRVGARTAFLQQASDATGGVFLHYDPLMQSQTSTNGTTANGNGARVDQVKVVNDSTASSNNQNAAAAGLLQTLLMAYLPDVTARRHLVPAGSAEVDFRAACFCHGKVVSLGGVCSVCLSSTCFPIVEGCAFHTPLCPIREDH